MLRVRSRNFCSREERFAGIPSFTDSDVTCLKREPASSVNLVRHHPGVEVLSVSLGQQNLEEPRSMAQQGSSSGRGPSRDYTATLDPFPELWTEILRRVPEVDRRAAALLSQIPPPPHLLRIPSHSNT